MRLLFLGDVVGRAGREVISSQLPRLKERYDLDFVIVNGENAAGGHGITEKIYQEFRDAGADVVTTGNHVWDQREALIFIEREPRLLRPLNYPAGTPGKGCGLFEAGNGAQVLVINAMGRVFMNDLDCPFLAVEREIEMCGLKEVADVIFIDFHAEATSEKQAFAHYFDGRTTCIVGTHTHVPTSDYRVLNGGTGYMSDVGMCGDYDSVLGMEKDEPVQRFISRIPSGRFQPSLGAPTLCGLAIEVDDATGLVKDIEPVRLGGCLKSTEPDFWVK
ncbi:MAG: TIGR00282 family metallophosphoesterase [Methyloligellaceae bacterium]